jgi:hypothetical protein
MIGVSAYMFNMIGIETIAKAIVEAREGALPGREAAAVNAVMWRAFRLLR